MKKLLCMAISMFFIGCASSASFVHDKEELMYIKQDGSRVKKYKIIFRTEEYCLKYVTEKQYNQYKIGEKVIIIDGEHP